jgi:hypothetical protein
MSSEIYNFLQGYTTLPLKINPYYTAAIQWNTNSGRIVWRKKAGGAIKHTGIYLGICQYTGIEYCIHNHPTQGRASIVTASEFAQGQQVNWDITPCSNSPEQIIEYGLSAVVRGIPYRLLSSNCQHLTSTACNNRKESPDLAKWGFLGGIALIGVALIGAR